MPAGAACNSLSRTVPALAVPTAWCERHPNRNASVLASCEADLLCCMQEARGSGLLSLGKSFHQTRVLWSFSVVWLQVLSPCGAVLLATYLNRKYPILDLDNIPSICTVSRETRTGWSTDLILSKDTLLLIQFLVLLQNFIYFLKTFS